MNLDQNVDKPWNVHIHDVTATKESEGLHLIPMESGDLVFYESAKCMHGRPVPLDGEYYVNLFAHTRPADGYFKGDWWSKKWSITKSSGKNAEL